MRHSEHTYTSHDGLKLFYREYGHEKAGIPILCLPGITRNSRDFEDIAEHLADRHRVLAVDFRGRGFSEHDQNWRNYHPRTYADDVVQLLDTLNINRLLLLGTSLGGLVSMILAAELDGRIAGLILNDIGPEIGEAGLTRIKAYIGRIPPVDNWAQAAAQAQEIYELAWPGLSDEMWLRIAKRGYREDEQGVPRLDIDPAIGDAARTVATGLLDPWKLFVGLTKIPLLVIQGALSDILTDDIVRRMRDRKPDLHHLKLDDRGHPALLDEPDCLRAIDRFVGGFDAST